MVSEEAMHLHASSDSNDFSRDNLQSTSKAEINANESKKDSDIIDDGIFAIEDLGQQKEENQVSHTIVEDLNKDGGAQPLVQSVELVESLSVSHLTKVDIIQSDNSDKNSALVDQREELGIAEMDGVNRPQALCSNKESSVRVLYSSLPSQSKRKLEELLHHWSEWHAKQFSLSEDVSDSLESGEETYFPALHVGSDKLSTVSFSMDVHVQKRQRKESVPTDHGCSSLYDRGFAIGLASDEGVSEDRACDLREAPRCFNCGSYNHSLSDCSKPRNNAAVNSARKQFLSKKSQTAGPRVPTRYYQESPGGKFDGLKPGALSAETKELLGIGELDPPPWLNRMRELGYPPGYLGLEEEDQPSGITIFGDEETHNAALRDDSPSTLDAQKSQKKITVDFPGINAPIPENADQWRWAAPVPRAPPVSDFCNHVHDSMNNRHFRGEYGPRNHFQGPSYHLGLGSNPPVSHHPYNYRPSEPFSPRGLPIHSSPNYRRSLDTGRPFPHYSYGSSL